ncbi:MAG: SecE/Sec61-gamma subunit of protein translocation complex [Rickettsiaceae bacterium]|nr:SecE/Sec61-gamma subunit of protein translocation complex [Rickettsiaceae bacterium]
MLLFFKDVIAELKKLHTPTKKEVYITTITILVVVAASALVIMLADFLISKIIKILFGL